MRRTVRLLALAVAVALAGVAAAAALAPGAGSGSAIREGPRRTEDAPPGATAPALPPGPAAAAEPGPEAGPSPPGGLAAVDQPDPRARQALRRRLEDLVAEGLAPLPGRVGVVVLDRAGQVVLEHHPAAPLLPASTQKLVTAAAALEVLGPGFRFATEVWASHPPEAGVVDGDLLLVGGGDPALATTLFGEVIYPHRPRTPLEALADRLVEGGLGRVTGDVVGDPSVLADQPLAPGWKATYLEDLDARRVSGLTVNAGLSVGIEGRDLDTLEVEAATDPALRAAVALADLLRERGVAIQGGPAVGTTPRRRRLTVVHSPPLATLLGHTLRRSDNHMADAVFRFLGASAPGRGWSAGAAAARRALTGLGLDLRGAVLADGSGLSRSDRLTAGQLARLDRRVRVSARGDRWRDLMAVAGRSGTLRGWLEGTVAAGAFAGKTGSLEDVRSVAGAVDGPDGRRYHLAILANGLDRWQDRARARLLMRALVLTLAADLHGCAFPTLTPGSGGQAPGELVPGACPAPAAADPLALGAA